MLAETHNASCCNQMKGLPRPMVEKISTWCMYLFSFFSPPTYFVVLFLCPPLRSEPARSRFTHRFQPGEEIRKPCSWPSCSSFLFFLFGCFRFCSERAAFGGPEAAGWCFAVISFSFPICPFARLRAQLGTPLGRGLRVGGWLPGTKVCFVFSLETVEQWGGGNRLPEGGTGKGARA